MINLLAGSLAEAKYVAERDDEVFNDRLVNIEALHFYGGSSDLSVISDYLTCFLPDKNKRDQKLNELFLAAFSFINQRSNWNAIISLADYILAAPNRLISCEEAMTLLEFHLAA